ncbi:MAG: type II secretion system protein [Thermoguttaceae bacterium]
MMEPFSRWKSDARKSEPVHTRRVVCYRGGFTLLELLISLVILSGCIVIIGELTRHSLRDARQTQNLIQAELLAESILSRCIIGEIELLPVAERPIEESEDSGAWDGAIPRWLYSIDISTIDETGLLELIVTVRENLPLEQRPTTCVLTRWLIDPDVENPPEEEEETTAESGTM